MTIQFLSDLKEKHKNCVKCPLHEERIKANNSVCVGTGLANSVGIIIVPQPIYEDGVKPNIYRRGSQEEAILQAIFKRVGLSLEDWFLTSAISCKGDPNDRNIDACGERLSDTLFAISPAIVVCLGERALRAYLGETSSFTRDQNPISDQVQCNAIVYTTHDISDYIKLKAEKGNWETKAAEMFADWKDIKLQYDNIVND